MPRSLAAYPFAGELCIPLSGLAAIRLDLVSVAVHAKPLVGHIDFISVSLAPALEPPIS